MATARGIIKKVSFLKKLISNYNLYSVFVRPKKKLAINQENSQTSSMDIYQGLNSIFSENEFTLSFI